MTVEKVSQHIAEIVSWINENVKTMDRDLDYGFGDPGIRRFPSHGREWNLRVRRDGSVEIDSVYLHCNFDRWSDPDTRYYPHYTYDKIAEKDLAGANDLLLEWPRIKSKILDEIERLNSLENFEV